MMSQMTAAMIDRLVHHSYLLLFDGQSYRMRIPMKSSTHSGGKAVHSFRAQIVRPFPVEIVRLFRFKSSTCSGSKNPVVSASPVDQVRSEATRGMKIANSWLVIRYDLSSAFLIDSPFKMKFYVNCETRRSRTASATRWIDD